MRSCKCPMDGALKWFEAKPAIRDQKSKASLRLKWKQYIAVPSETYQ
ncbi:MAG: hypothetical protein JSR93_06445 [Verrucomicrobia bacterium]|nr:hypothetical protein [Verrucomicrobiota bacterium]